MRQRERRRIVQERLRDMQWGRADFVIVEDSDRPDNYVQFGTGGSAHEMRFEVTSRAYPDQVLPPLTEQQVDDLVALGLNPRANPNHAMDITAPSPDSVIELVETAFRILGSPRGFVPRISTGFWQKSSLLHPAVSPRRISTEP